MAINRELPRPLLASRRRFRGWKGTAGISLLEVMMGAMIITLYATEAIPALMTMNRNATSNRLITAAKEVVNRNIEAADAVPFTSSSVPAILAVTSGTVACGDYAYTSLTNPMPLVTATNGSAIISGTLSRCVTLWNASDSTDNPNTRRITFTFNYKFVNRTFSYSATTLRAPDQ